VSTSEHTHLCPPVTTMSTQVSTSEHTHCVHQLPQCPLKWVLQNTLTCVHQLPQCPLKWVPQNTLTCVHQLPQCPLKWVSQSTLTCVHQFPSTLLVARSVRVPEMCIKFESNYVSFFFNFKTYRDYCVFGRRIQNWYKQKPVQRNLRDF